MKDNIFSQGIEPGGLRNKQDIKVLICYMFCKIGRMRKQEVLSALQEKGLANYFEAGEAFSELVCKGNIDIDKETGEYFASESGQMISDELYDTLPLSVRRYAVESGETTVKRAKIEEENKVKIEKNKFGYSVNCSISGGDFDLLNFNLYVPDINQAEKVKENFRKDPEGLYYAVLAVLTRKKDLDDKFKKYLSELMG